MQVTLDAAAISAVLGALGGMIATAGAAWTFVVKPLRATSRRFSQFAEDWEGEPDRPGVPGRDGVMVRLANIEANQSAHIASHNTSVIVASLSSGPIANEHPR